MEAFSRAGFRLVARIEASKGAVYITNIPPGVLAEKITSDLGVY